MPSGEVFADPGEVFIDEVIGTPTATTRLKGCPHKGCDGAARRVWSGFCGPEHREAYFESIGAGNALPIFHPNLVPPNNQD